MRSVRKRSARKLVSPAAPSSTQRYAVPSASCAALPIVAAPAQPTVGHTGDRRTAYPGPHWRSPHSALFAVATLRSPLHFRWVPRCIVAFALDTFALLRRVACSCSDLSVRPGRRSAGCRPHGRNAVGVCGAVRSDVRARTGLPVALQRRTLARSADRRDVALYDQQRVGHGR